MEASFCTHQSLQQARRGDEIYSLTPSASSVQHHMIFPDTSLTNICNFPALVSVFHLSFASQFYLVFPMFLFTSFSRWAPALLAQSVRRRQG